MISKQYLINQLAMGKNLDKRLLSEIPTEEIESVSNMMRNPNQGDNSAVELIIVALLNNTSLALPSEDGDFESLSGIFQEFRECRLRDRKALYNYLCNKQMEPITKMLLDIQPAKKSFYYAGKLWGLKTSKIKPKLEEYVKTAVSLILRLHPFIVKLEEIKKICPCNNAIDMSAETGELIKLIDFPYTSVANILYALGMNYVDNYQYNLDKFHVGIGNNEKLFVWARPNSTEYYVVAYDQFVRLYQQELLDTEINETNFQCLGIEELHR